MDIKAYIESGILESYVMRLTSPEETAEVESMIASHPEIAAAVLDFEMRLEQRLTAEAQTPPAEVKQRLMTVLADEFNTTGETQEPGPAPVVGMRRPAPAWKYIAAASIALLLGSGGLNIHYYNKYNETQASYNKLLADRESLLARADANEAKATDAENTLKMMMDVAVKKVIMASPNQDKIATLYWNSLTKEVFLSKHNLPHAPSGKQYQLWALVKGQPVNAGMIGDCGQALCKMLNMPQADAFAITLEKEGGSPTPDLTQLQVMGKI
ncbi:MAG: anti-sigma factor [Agriterribacter sp.]